MGVMPVISARNFSKTFAGRTVLHGVDLDIWPGEIHGLVGQNGSGKSTFIKILSGYYVPDPGAELCVRGDQVSLPLSPRDLRRLGMSFVHQDLGLFEQGTVLENLRVGRYDTGLFWYISWRREREQVRCTLAQFNLNLDPDTSISGLSDVERAMIAIVRALEQTGRSLHGLLVLDEPTSYLPTHAVDRLFVTVRQVADLGFGVLFVSHRLDEIRAITDQVTILRDGRIVITTQTRDLTERDLVTYILGFSLDQLYPAPHRPEREIVLKAQGVFGAGVTDFSLDLHKGEIIGLTGLLGMGHEQIPYLLFGAIQAAHGTLTIDGHSYDLVGMQPDKAIAAGLALLPANRLRDGGVATASARENLTLPTIDRYFRHGLLRHRKEKAATRHAMETFMVHPVAPENELGTFSGGNQQKILLAKWFATRPRVLLLHEPTHGVDVGAKRQIFRLIRDAAQSGTAVMIASVEYEDLAHLCDRVIVFQHGRATSELYRSNLTRERIMERCFLDEPLLNSEKDTVHE